MDAYTLVYSSFKNNLFKELLENNLIYGEKALDIGSGTGYLTLCMARMMGKKGKAYGIEHIP